VRWGLSAAEGPFDRYHAHAAPTAALATDAGIVSDAASVAAEAEDGAGDGILKLRGNASGARAIQLDSGESRTLTIDAPYTADYRIVVRYSNDNFGPLETLEVRVDGELVDSFLAEDTGDFGTGWNTFVESNEWGPVALQAGVHEVTVSVSGGDGFGVELDLVRLLHDAIIRPPEDGTVTVYGAGSAIHHVPEYAVAALWDAYETGLFHPRFGAADAYNANIEDAVVNETVGGEILRTLGPWMNPTGFSIDHGPMAILIDNYLEGDFAPGLFMSYPTIAEALGQLFPDWEPENPWVWRNSFNRYDVNDDGIAAPLDVLRAINELNRGGSRMLPAPDTAFQPPPYYDVNGDGWLTPADALVCINYLNRQLAAMIGEGEFDSYSASLMATLPTAVPTSMLMSVPMSDRTHLDRWRHREAVFAMPLDDLLSPRRKVDPVNELEIDGMAGDREARDDTSSDWSGASDDLMVEDFLWYDGLPRPSTAV